MFTPYPSPSYASYTIPFLSVPQQQYLPFPQAYPAFQTSTQRAPKPLPQRKMMFSECPPPDQLAAWVKGVLEQHGGRMTGANLGSTLATSNPGLYRTIKNRYGGLTPLLKKFRDLFTLENDPPFNHISIYRTQTVPISFQPHSLPGSYSHMPDSWTNSRASNQETGFHGKPGVHFSSKQSREAPNPGSVHYSPFSVQNSEYVGSFLRPHDDPPTVYGPSNTVQPSGIANQSLVSEKKEYSPSQSSKEVEETFSLFSLSPHFSTQSSGQSNRSFPVTAGELDSHHVRLDQVVSLGGLLAPEESSFFSGSPFGSAWSSHHSRTSMSPSSRHSSPMRTEGWSNSPFSDASTCTPESSRPSSPQENSRREDQVNWYTPFSESVNIHSFLTPLGNSGPQDLHLPSL